MTEATFSDDTLGVQKGDKLILLECEEKNTLPAMVLNELSEDRLGVYCCPKGKLTNNIEVVGVVDGPILILHEAGVIAFVRRDHALHDQAPVLVSYLKRLKGSRLLIAPDTCGILP